jgi:hypothetical protein
VVCWFERKGSITPQENPVSGRIWAYFGDRVSLFLAILARKSRSNKLPTSATATATATASATASATATASPLPTTGGPPLVGPLTWVATLTLVASGVGAMVLLRREVS